MQLSFQACWTNVVTELGWIAVHCCEGKKEVQFTARKHEDGGAIFYPCPTGWSRGKRAIQTDRTIPLERHIYTFKSHPQESDL